MGFPGKELQPRWGIFSMRRVADQGPWRSAGAGLVLILGLAVVTTTFPVTVRHATGAQPPGLAAAGNETAAPARSSADLAVQPTADQPDSGGAAARKPSQAGSRDPGLTLPLSLLALLLAFVAAWLSERRRRGAAERRWQESEERMGLVAAAVELGLWRWRVDGDRLWADANCRRLLGMAADTPAKLRTLLKAMHPEDRVRAWREIEDAVRAGRSYWVKYRAVMDDGSERWLLASGSGRTDAAGNPARLTGIVVDVTEQQRAEREVERQRDELAHLARVAILAELSGTLAHELNQPLTAILSNAQAALRLMQGETVGREAICEILNDIVADDSRAGEVIRRFRALLKKGAIERRAIDPNNLVTSVVALMRNDLARRQVRLVLQLAPRPPAILGDSVQLQQVLINFILNGCDAMQEKPPPARVLTIASGLDAEGALCVSVADQGCGIAADAKDRLFEPFFTTKPEGLGLGLSISRSILLAHGGRLRAENNPKGGATFSFAIPVERVKMAEAAA